MRHSLPTYSPCSNPSISKRMFEDGIDAGQPRLHHLRVKWLPELRIQVRCGFPLTLFDDFVPAKRHRLERRQH